MGMIEGDPTVLEAVLDGHAVALERLDMPPGRRPEAPEE